MKKITSIIYLALLVSSCMTFQEKSNVSDKKILNAVISDETTKTYLNRQHQNMWFADDRISAFVGNTYNQQYAFKGSTGDNAGDFSKVQGGSLSTGEDINAIYAIYPYASSNSITENGVITAELPCTQQYAADSFGQGANTMVAVTAGVDDSFLKFKNICGYLIIKVYGDAQITSITLSGNNGEKISGKAKITPSYSGAPSVAMDNAANSSVNLDCGSGVSLGSGSASATSFWFALPPTNFGKGISITVNSADGKSMTKSTSKSISVARNTYYTLSPFKYEGKVDESTNITIPDANFKAYLVENFDEDGDGEISIAEAEVVEMIDVYTDDIATLEGIEYFINLKRLYACGRYGYEWVSGDTFIICVYSKLVALDVSKNTALTVLHCNYNQLTGLDVSKNTVLTSLECGYNQLTNLDVSKNTALTVLYCGNNQLINLDVSKNTALTSLYCDNNQLINLDVSKNTALTSLYCDNNQLAGLDVSKNTVLTSLECGYNQLTNLDVSKNIVLTYLYCDYNPFTTLDLSHCSKKFDWLECYSDVNKTVYLAPDQTIENLNKSDNVTIVYGSPDMVNIPDANFKAYLVENFDEDGDGEISIEEGYAITDIHVDTRNIASLRGIEWFPNLQRLYASGGWDGGLLTEVDVSKNSRLEHLDLWGNKLTSIDVSHNTALRDINLDINQLTSLDVTKNTTLTSLGFTGNRVTSIDVSNNTELSILCCDEDQLTALDVSRNTKLVRLSCGYNQLTTLDVSNNTSLTRLDCGSDKPLTVYLAVGQRIETINKNDNVTLVYGRGNINIPDANFRRYLVQHFDNDGDGEISIAEAGTIHEIHVCTDDIETLEGIEYFINLGYLDACGTGEDIDGKRVSNGKLRSLNVSRNTALYCLYCENNQLTSLDVSNNTALEDLRCQYNQLTTLDLSKNTSLAFLDCYNNQLTKLDVSSIPVLHVLQCGDNPILCLDLTHNSSIKGLWAPGIEQIWVSRGHSFDWVVGEDALKYYGQWEAIDLGLSVKWATFNLGAGAPWESGEYYAWGEISPKERYDWDNLKYCTSGKIYYAQFSKYVTDTSGERGPYDGKTTLDMVDDPARCQLGAGWRMPTIEECKELIDECTWEWTSQGDRNGYKVISKKNGKCIFLPAAGKKEWQSLYDDNLSGYYSNSSISDYVESSCELYFDQNTKTGSNSGGYRTVGRSVRPVCF